MAFARGHRISLHRYHTSGLPWPRPALLATACSVVCLLTHSSTRPSCSCTDTRLPGPTLVTRRWPDTDYNIVDDVAPSQTGLVINSYVSLTRFHVADCHYPQAKQPLSRTSSTTSGNSRHTSTSSYAQSVGPGHHRPQTSMGNNFGQSTNGHGRPRANTSRRPATAMSNRGPDPDTTTGSQCMNSPVVSFSLSSQSQRFSSSSRARNGALFNPRLRPSSSMPSFIPSPSPSVAAKCSSSSSRQSSLGSLTSRFGHMTISEEGEEEETSRVGDPQKNGGQVNSKREGQSAARAEHRGSGPRLSDTTVRAGRREKVAVGQ